MVTTSAATTMPMGAAIEEPVKPIAIAVTSITAAVGQSEARVTLTATPLSTTSSKSSLSGVVEGLILGVFVYGYYVVIFRLFVVGGVVLDVWFW